MLDRDTIINITLGKSDTDIIYEYCIEMGKDKDKSYEFSSFVSFTPFYKYCFNYALDYYQRKFNVCILRDKEGKIINVY